MRRDRPRTITTGMFYLLINVSRILAKWLAQFNSPVEFKLKRIEFFKIGGFKKFEPDYRGRLR